MLQNVKPLKRNYFFLDNPNLQSEQIGRTFGNSASVGSVRKSILKSSYHGTENGS